MRVGHWVPAYGGMMRCEIATQMLRDCGTVSRYGHEYRCWYTDGNGIARLRNQALETARSEGLDYLMMQDADIYSPSGSPLYTLLQTAEETSAALVAAPCGLRRGERLINVYPWNAGEVYEAEKVGTGMLLIDVRQVTAWSEKYSGPWFATTFHDERQADLDVGEDVFFSLVARQNGGKVFVNGQVATNHVSMNSRHLEYVPPTPKLAEGDDSLEKSGALVNG